jgi:transposase InsO family protein
MAEHSRRAEARTRQAARREAEAAVRGKVVALSDMLVRQGQTRGRTANRLCLSRRTVSRWRRQCSWRPRGRPPKESPVADRWAVLDLVDREGPHLGLPSIRAAFPAMPRCELQGLQAAYRRHFQATHRRWIDRLQWPDPGKVWAMDHAMPPSPIDGEAEALLSVRDLASGAALAWQPVMDLSAAPTIAALEILFLKQGAPLVMKSDNGSAFRSDDLQELLAHYRIVWLPSPPRRPWYNGSCEAGIGSLKTRTRHFAGNGAWTTAALEAARRQANELNRPAGPSRPTPAERWAASTPPTAAQRDAFLVAVEQNRACAIAQRGDGFDPDNQNQYDQVQRQAVQQALVEFGLLTITRRSVPLPLKPKKRDKIM